MHRVFNHANSERFSWPFFFDPTWDVAIHADSTKTYGDYAIELYEDYL